MAIVEYLIAAFEKLTTLLAAIAAFLVLAMSVWISYDVMVRNVFGYGSPWFFDLSEYALVWITFLAAPWVLLRDRHVRIEILVDVLPIKVQRALGIVVCVLAIATCCVLAWRTGVAAIEYYQRNVMMPRIWRIPRIWPYSIIPIGSVLLTLAFLVRLYHYASSKDPEARLKESSEYDSPNPVSDRKGASH